MVYRNAEDETQAARGSQKISRNSYNPNGSKGIRCSSTIVRNQSIRFSREDWPGRNFIGYFGENANISGGTLAQLIAELEQEIAESEARVTNLRNHLQKFRSLQGQLGESE